MNRDDIENLLDDPFKNPVHLANTADALGRVCKNWQSSTARYHFACRDTIRSLLARLEDAEAAQALVVERAADEAAGEVAAHGEAHLAPFVRRRIRALAPADALAEVQRLREEQAFTLSDGQRLLRKCDVEGVCDATDLCFENPNTVVRCGPCAAKVSSRAGVPLNPYTHGNPEAMRLRRERDAALARVEKLRHQITEASEPDFIWGALDHVHDDETTLDDYAAAVSRAIRGAMQITGEAE